MRLPGRVIGEARLPLGRQAADHRPGERAAAHVGQRRVVDHVVGVAGAQQVEEVEPALGRPRAEPGEVVVADLRAEAVAASVACAGVVHRDPGSGLQPRPQHVTAFDQKTVLAIDQQPHHLALRDAETHRAQLGGQPLHRYLTLMVLQQSEAAQLRPEMAGDALRQRRHHPPPVRRHPAFPAIADHLGAQHQVLDDEGVISFEPRARRHVHTQHPALDADPRCGLAASTMPAMARRLRRRRIVHAARLDVGAALDLSIAQSRRAAPSRHASARQPRQAV